MLARPPGYRAGMPADPPALPSPLVSTQWLADHLGADGLLVIDASVASYLRPDGRVGYLSGHEQYLLEGHVPGAVFADLVDEFSDPDGGYPFTRPDAERFAAAAGALGVDSATTVVVYDTAVGQWASRLWWLFRTFGFDRVALLDAGRLRALGTPLEVLTEHLISEVYRLPVEVLVRDDRPLVIPRR